MDQSIKDRQKAALLFVASGGLLLGLGLRVSGHTDAARLVWTLATLPILSALFVEM